MHKIFLTIFILLLFTSKSFADAQVTQYFTHTPVKVPSYTGNNVGIGSSSPQHTLEVIGSVSASSIHLSDPTLHLTAQSGMLLDPNGNGAVINVNSNGNVGIGSALPGQILDVHGTIRTTGFALTTGASSGKFLKSDANGNGSWATSSGSGTVTSVGLSSPNNTLSIGSTPVTTSGTITSDINWTDVNGIAAINSGAFNWQNIQGYQSGYVLFANPPNSANWQVPPGGSSQWATQNTTDVSLAGGNVGLGTTKTTTAALTVMNGNLGIGTWVPASAVDVVGSVNASGSFTATGSGNKFARILTNNIIESTNNQAITIGSGISVASNVVDIPATATSFTNTSGTSADLALIPTYNQASGSATNTDLLINRTETALGSGAQRLIDAQVGGISKFTIDHSGNIGIGSTLPGQLLDVRGTIRGIGYASSDGSLGVTGSTCSAWKNGLCTSS